MPRRILDLENYVPNYLTQCVNKWAHSSSRLYLARFGLGINEWRTMTLLALQPGISAAAMSTIMGMDKALISRSIRMLEQQKLAARDVPVGRGTRAIQLTPAGLDVYHQILELALEREKQLLDGLTKDEVKLLLVMLRRLTENAVRIQASEAALLQDEKKSGRRPGATSKIKSRSKSSAAGE